MIGTPITIKNFDSGEEITINDHTDKFRVVALQTFPTFANEVRASNIPRSGAHGEFHMPTYYSGMSIVLEGVIVGDNENEVWELKRKLDEVTRLPLKGFSAPTQSEDIRVLATNLAINPRGSISLEGWTGQNSLLANVLGQNGITVEADASGLVGASFTQETAIEGVVSAGVDIRNETDDAKDYTLTLTAFNGATEVASINITETLESNETKRLSATLAEAVNATEIVVKLEQAGSMLGDLFFLDRLLIASDLPENFDIANNFFDGNTAELSRVRYEWSGLANLSESKMLLKSFPSMFRNSLRVSFVNPLGIPVFVDATPTTVVRYNRGLQERYRLNFQILLRANVPYLTHAESLPANYYGMLGERRTGFKVPFEVPLSLSTEYVENPLIIDSPAQGFAIVRMYGSDNGIIVNPRITNTTNGSTVRILQSLVGSRNFFLIDGMYQQMVDQDGRNIQPYSDGDYIFLERGENVLFYSADETIAD